MCFKVYFPAERVLFSLFLLPLVWGLQRNEWDISDTLIVNTSGGGWDRLIFVAWRYIGANGSI